MARQVGKPKATTIGELMKGVYRANADDHVRRLNMFIEQHARARAASLTDRFVVSTKVAKDMLNVARLVYENRTLGLVLGPSGIGKSRCALAIHEKYVGSIYYSVMHGGHHPKGLTAALADKLGVRKKHLHVFAIVGAVLLGRAVTPALAQCELDKLTASDGEPLDYYGDAVAISDLYVVAAGDSDSAYVFRRQETGWIEEAILAASDSPGGEFGCAVAIDGKVAVIGAKFANGVCLDGCSNSGAAYVFRRFHDAWAEEAKISGDDAASWDRFGASVAMSGEYVLIGAYKHDSEGDNAGAAYIFKREGVDWIQQAKLTASDADPEDYFGVSVAIDGDYAVVGAPGYDEYYERAGAAYVFRREGDSWVEQAKLPSSSDRRYKFGEHISLSGNWSSCQRRDHSTRVQATGHGLVGRGYADSVR